MEIYGQVNYVLFCDVSVLALGIVAANFAYPYRTAADMFHEKNEINIQYNTTTLYCPGPGNSCCSVRHTNMKYKSREIKIQINSLLKQYVNINHNTIQD